MRALLLLLALAACDRGKKDEKPVEKTPPPAATVSADGVRKVDVAVNEKGYVPDRIVGKPGEKLNLVFKRTVEGECLAKLKAPDGKEIDLPMNTPVELAVTVPQQGELAFACGMEMFKGTIVAQPSG